MYVQYVYTVVYYFVCGRLPFCFISFEHWSSAVADWSSTVADWSSAVADCMLSDLLVSWIMSVKQHRNMVDCISTKKNRLVYTALIFILQCYFA